MDAAHCTTGTALEAIRRVRDEVRAIAAQLPVDEEVEARRWDEGGGCIGALGALHRGEACGFALRHGAPGASGRYAPRGAADRLVREEVGPGVRCEGPDVVPVLPDDVGRRDRRWVSEASAPLVVLPGAAKEKGRRSRLVVGRMSALSIRWERTRPPWLVPSL
ncbi:hypothetical protein [Streptomyces sp. NPDC008125]|uniref:hypothetical protein n=1 Tax=Streptomyces sp. NPDC008125 TaxID=3364811 RepID=UPI0036E5D23E